MSNVAFINSCPLVLCGPLLRRVDANSVTVWFALKAAANITVRVFSGEDANGQGTGLVQEGSRQTVQLGTYLHIVAVTTSGTALASGTTYRYSVAIDSTGFPAGASLFDAGVVSESTAGARALLLYSSPGAPQLPTFVTPPADPATLRVLHGSCRKPHGESIDMLPTADALIGAALRDGAPRPHQLLLTGDQIYADDVADPMLALIQNVADALEMPVETLPDRMGRWIDIRRLAIGHREELLEEEASFTAGEVAKSHLLTFSEFAVMYLLVWSNVLWRDGVPEFPRVHPSDYAALGDDYEKIRRGEWTWSNLLRPRAVGRLTGFLAERRATVAFKDRLREVRRAMAHVPCLMLFDDHEITDDWYLSKRWCENALLPYSSSRPEPGGSLLGRRIIQNGLLAYTLFQGWGNTPAQFAPTGAAGQNGRELLAHASAWNGTEDTHSAEIARLLGLPTEIAAGTPLHVPGQLTYHYAVTWPGYQLLMVDTRTRRVFSGGPDEPPALLNDDGSLAEMLTSQPDPGPDAVTLIVSPAPIIGVPLIEQSVQPLMGSFGKGSRESVDYEAWGLNAPAFQKLLGHLFTPSSSTGSPRRRVVSLGGDVHYGYAARVRYSATAPFQRTGGASEGVVAQLTSSALKNEDWKTRIFHGMGYVAGVDQLPEEEHAVGWANPTGKRLLVGEREVPTDNGDRIVPWAVKGSPGMSHLGPERTLSLLPEWQYTVSFIHHTEDDPTLPPRPPSSAVRPIQDFDPADDREVVLGRYLAAAANHRDYLGPWGSGKEIVGLNNLGEVSFTWQAGDAKKVIQTLWWRLEGMNDAAPLTHYIIDLALGPSLYAGQPVAAPSVPASSELQSPTRKTS
ncbi:DUF7800 domain-containing protein [Archangium violaceum]|uniref:DUF7800 domain-containing protein n=1 Tax=Archangium violaceum TaxID=83451 RepID=UPI0036DCF6B1